ncbi:DUF3450 domain-containing protein [Methylotuvimicrobium sp. KM2]|uniref:DUF3450 domain-containing protein n=1 Tax=Methylotuvimicrobium sp. KM2 TaxID=3133976 RepID=UPI003100C68D
MFLTRRFPKALAGVTVLFLSAGAYSDPLNQAIDTGLATNKAAVDSQKTIDRLSDQTQKMLEEFRTASRNADTLQTYNKHLKDLLASQQQEKASLERQLDQIEDTQREIVPLILRMLDSLEQFIALDVPFLPEERQERLSQLKDMINRADVTPAEKFRRIIEAFQVENEYGNTIEAYRADLELGGSVSSVDFLRLGRVALYFQRLDGSETGYWNKETQSWETLPSSYRNAIRDGLRIARKEAAPDLLTLPLPAPEVSQ